MPACSLPIVGGAALRDRETFYRQFVQDTVKEAAGKLKLNKSGLDFSKAKEFLKELVLLFLQGYWHI